MARKKKPRATASTQKSATPGKLVGAAFLLGVLVVMLGLGLLGNEITSLIWRLKARWFYQEGRARIEKTEITKREGAYDLDIYYHLEVDGKSGRSTMRQEQDDPSASTMADAEKRQTRYPVGRLLPCWYSLEDPDGHHELVPDGLQVWLPVQRMWMSLLVIAAGIFLCRPLWRSVRKDIGKSAESDDET